MQNSDYLISLPDLARTLWNQRRAILRAAVVGAVLLGLVALNRPVLYEAKGTFRDAGERHSSGLLQQALNLGGSSQSEVAALISSRRYMTPVIQKEGLQVVMSERRFVPGSLRRFAANLKIQLYRSLRPGKAVFSDTPPVLNFQDVTYEGVDPLSIEIKVLDDSHFEAQVAGSKDWVSGSFESPFSTSELAFTASLSPDALKRSKTYSATVLPADRVADALISQLQFETKTGSSNITELSLRSTDRHQAAKILNSLMLHYKTFQRLEQGRLAAQQFAYLQERCNQAKDRLAKQLSLQANEHLAGAHLSGFSDREAHIEFLTNAYIQLRKEEQELTGEKAVIQRLLDNHLEECACISWENSSPGIEKPVQRWVERTTQRDILSQALEAATNPFINPISSNFLALSLEQADQLCMEHQQELRELDLATKSYNSLSEQLEDPLLFSQGLAGCPDSPTVQAIVQKTCKLALDLNGQEIQTERERSRIEKEIEQQQRFLKAHCEKQLSILAGLQKFQEERVYQLQNVILKRLDQEITQAEHEITEGLELRHYNLEHQEAYLKQQMASLREEMHTLSDRWTAEGLADLDYQLDQNLLEHAVKVSEATSLEHYTRVSMAGPLDFARPPKVPMDPRLVLFASLGAILGALGAGLSCIFFTVFRGVPVRPTELHVASNALAGKLSSRIGKAQDLATDGDLESLRRIVNRWAEIPTSSLPLACCVLSQGPNYSPALAELLQNRGERVLCIDIRRRKDQEREGAPDIGRALKGELELPKLVPERWGARITFDAVGRHSIDQVFHPKFQEMLESFSKQFSKILLLTDISPLSASALALESISQVSIYTLNKERLPELGPLLSGEGNPPRLFLFQSSCDV